MDLFSHAWSALRATVAALADEDFSQPSGCASWLVRDLAYHLIIDAQDVLITLATPADGTPTADATTYWHVTNGPPAAEDPLSALTVRLAAAYEDMALLKFHLDDVGAAAARAAKLADPTARVTTQGQVLTVEDYLTAYVLEWTLHHLDLTAHLPTAPAPPPRPCPIPVRHWNGSRARRSPRPSRTRMCCWPGRGVRPRRRRRRPNSLPLR
ncbi:conserved hypothetical protein [Streptomyces scabiei 87.22]|uniref:Mycothiol-dependent maleylpyruvate isomerase metal-binding domain-containing protein n=7 Tax=Streptomyces TaxID=1883 RepID=C9ZFV9_STRSW|nr:conserved hypothetical protein [Streptomyces scabiei 87.22]